MIAFTRNERKLPLEDPDSKVQYVEERENYAGTLGVYHELYCLVSKRARFEVIVNEHCQRRIRKFVHREYWYENSTEKEVEFQRTHAGRK